MLETKIWTNSNVQNPFSYLDYDNEKLSKEQILNFQKIYITNLKLYNGIKDKIYQKAKDKSKIKDNHEKEKVMSKQ